MHDFLERYAQDTSPSALKRECEALIDEALDRQTITTSLTAGPPSFLLEDWHYYTYLTGEQTQPFVDRFATVGSELGYI